MIDALIERQLRKIPGVLAVSTSAEGITMLVHPEVHALVIEAQASATILQLGDARPVAVIGGSRPAAVGTGRDAFDIVPRLRTVAPAAALVGVAALVVGLAGSPVGWFHDVPASNGRSEAAAAAAAAQREAHTRRLTSRPGSSPFSILPPGATPAAPSTPSSPVVDAAVSPELATDGATEPVTDAVLSTLAVTTSATGHVATSWFGGPTHTAGGQPGGADNVVLAVATSPAPSDSSLSLASTNPAASAADDSSDAEDAVAGPPHEVPVKAGIHAPGRARSFVRSANGRLHRH